MNTTFNTILIPVDFTVNTDIAVEKALLLCEMSGSVHLLHVPEISASTIASFHQYFATYAYSDEKLISDCKDRIDEWRHYIELKRPDIQCFGHVELGNTIQNLVIHVAKKIDANLIIIGKHSHHSWLPFLNTVAPNGIAKKTGVPVLTVKPGARHRALKLVVIPIGNESPERKMELVQTLSKKFRIQVRLVSVLQEGDHSRFPPPQLIKAYRLLRDSISNVTYELLSGANKAKEVLQYCKEVKADMLIVHPGSETRTGWLDKQISDELSPASRMQVLAIQPS